MQHKSHMDKQADFVTTQVSLGKWELTWENHWEECTKVVITLPSLCEGMAGACMLYLFIHLYFIL